MFGGLRRAQAGAEPAPGGARRSRTSRYFGADTAEPPRAAGRAGRSRPRASGRSTPTRRARAASCRCFERQPLTRRVACTAAADFDRPPSAGSVPTPTPPSAQAGAGGAARHHGQRARRRMRRRARRAWLSPAGARRLFGGDLTRSTLGSRARRCGRSALMALSYERLLDAAQRAVQRRRLRLRLAPPDRRQRRAAAGPAEARLDKLGRPAPSRCTWSRIRWAGWSRARRCSSTRATSSGQRTRARGGRLLMLGTPNWGSYAPARCWRRQDSLATIAGAGRARSRRELAASAALRGPARRCCRKRTTRTSATCSRASTWTELQHDDPTLVVPDAATLKAARDYVSARLFRTRGSGLRADPECSTWPARAKPSCELRKRQTHGNLLGDGSLTPAAGLEFLVGPDGDGTVPWTSPLRARADLVRAMRTRHAGRSRGRASTPTSSC